MGVNMPADVFFTGYTGIVISIVIFFTLAIFFREVLCREAKFNSRTEMLSNMDKNFNFEPGDSSKMQISLSDAKRKFKI
jgi:hypothetical protein